MWIVEISARMTNPRGWKRVSRDSSQAWAREAAVRWAQDGQFVRVRYIE